MPEFGISDEERKKQRANLAKRSSAGMEKKYQDTNRSAVEEAELAMAPPVIDVPQCHVCQSERRLWIERQLMKGRSYAAIAKTLPPEKIGDVERTIDRRSIGNHAKHHMPLDAAVVRAVLEEEADLVGQSWEEGVRGAFTAQGALMNLIRKAYDDAMSNVTTVEPRDLIQMIKLYKEVAENSSVVAAEEAKTAVRIFTEAIQNVTDDFLDGDQANAFKSALVAEVKRLRDRDDIDITVEQHLGRPPREIESSAILVGDPAHFE